MKVSLLLPPDSMTEKKNLVHIEFQQKISKEIGIKVKKKRCKGKNLPKKASQKCSFCISPQSNYTIDFAYELESCFYTCRPSLKLLE